MDHRPADCTGRQRRTMGVLQPTVVNLRVPDARSLTNSAHW